MQWNAWKLRYDAALWVGIVLYVVVFMAVSSFQHTGAESLSPMTLLIRALGSLCFFLLTLILCIGPLTRLSTRFLPLLYNRRHLGVSLFVLALAHGALAMLWYHGFGVVAPLVSLFQSPGSLQSLVDVPFQPFGFFALLLLLLLASTSHDFWNANLGAPLWKAIHMSGYLAYTLVAAHLAFGALQDESTGFSPLLLFASILLVSGLHLMSAFKSCRATVDLPCAQAQWVDIGRWSDIPDHCGLTVSVGGAERVAVFRFDHNKLAAVSNACKHQNGPLAEGRVIDGLITCPWHGFQYHPADGCAPAPFNECIATYNLKLQEDRVLLDPQPLPEGKARPVLEIPHSNSPQQA